MPASLHINNISTTTGLHNHDYQQLMVVLQGRMHCELPNESTQLTRGSVGLLPIGTEHRYAGQDVDCRVLVLDFKADDPLIKALNEVSGQSFSQHFMAQAKVLKPQPSLDGLLRWYEGQRRFDHLHIPAIRNQLIAGLLTEVMIGEDAQAQREIRSTRIRPERLQVWVDARVHRSISVAEMANAFHTSESHLYVLMKNALGCSPATYINQRRMFKAQSLLKDTHLPIGNIALQLGFSDTAAFSKAFHRFFHTPPSRYRMRSAAMNTCLGSL